MNIQETELRPMQRLHSGGVLCLELPGNKTRVTRITTFCPDEIGPGPAHLYLIESDAHVLLDAGIPTYLAKAFFYHWRNQPVPPEVDQLAGNHGYQELVDGMTLAGHSLKDIDLLAISHGHPDHFLMAHAIVGESAAPVRAHIFDTPQISNPWGLLTMWLERQEQMHGTGMPAPWSAAESLREKLFRGFDLKAMGVAVNVDSPFFGNGPVTLDSAPIRDLEVVHTPGHSPGSIGLLLGNRDDGRVLLCGDTLLDPITPLPDDLLSYLRTLDFIEKLSDVQVALPAHGLPIRNLAHRVAFLKRHHRNRLERTFLACAEPTRVWDIATAPGYFDTYVDPTQFNFLAGNEALVHMELLTMVGGLSRCGIEDGVQYFRNSGEPFDEVYGRVLDLVNDSRAAAMMRY